jgi:hypothetical protein
MSVVIQITDFVGVFRVSQNVLTLTETTNKIDQFEKGHIYKLFGYELGQRVIEHFTTPDTDITALIAPFGFDKCNEVFISEGLKHYLLGLVYFDLINSERVQPSIQTGTAKKKSETGTSGAVDERQLYANYNSSIRTGKAIQRFAIDNETLYPEFNGQKILYNY